jgi:hypothetical protein
MQFLRRKFEHSPEYGRVAPFLIFVAFTALQGKLGEDSRYGLYPRLGARDLAESSGFSV